MNKVFLCHFVMLGMLVTSSCTKFYPTGISAEFLGKPKDAEAIEVVFTGTPTCSFQDVGTIVTRQNIIKDQAVVDARSKAGEIGADGIYDVKYMQDLVAVGSSFITEYSVQAKAYVCEKTVTTAAAVQRPNTKPAALAATLSPPVNEARTALVIGNAKYLRSPPLRTPPNDARALKDTLVGLGFDVTLIENGKRRDMVAGIEGFGQTLRRKGGVGLVFYAGHGVQIKGRNYLIPVDTSAETEVGLIAETVDLDILLGMMAESGTRINVVILDACRDNPFEKRTRGGGRGLTAINDAKGTLIAYSTDPGKTASDGEENHSPYAKALLDVLPTPNLSIEQVFKRVRLQVQDATGGIQTPWETSNLTGDFSF